MPCELAFALVWVCIPHVLHLSAVIDLGDNIWLTRGPLFSAARQEFNNDTQTQILASPRTFQGDTRLATLVTCSGEHILSSDFDLSKWSCGHTRHEVPYPSIQ